MKWYVILKCDVICSFDVLYVNVCWVTCDGMHLLIRKTQEHNSRLNVTFECCAVIETDTEPVKSNDEHVLCVYIILRLIFSAHSHTQTRERKKNP